MAVRIRLQRHGKKGEPFYHIIATDKRTPRNGRFIEKLGTYNPLTQPATILLDVDKTVQWLQDGATASDTAHAILKYKGVVYKNHLLNGVKKGALKAEDVEAKFQSWMDGKTAKIGGHEDKIKKAKSDAKTAKLEAEKIVNENRQKANEQALKAAEESAKAEETKEETTTDNVEASTETTENPEA
jgi:small subunit ribosomal protein S16